MTFNLGKGECYGHKKNFSYFWDFDPNIVNKLTDDQKQFIGVCLQDFKPNLEAD